MQILGNNIQKRRKKLKISAETLAKKVKVSRSYITLIENGKRLPSKRYFTDVCETLDISVTTLIRWYLADIKIKLTS